MFNETLIKALKDQIEYLQSEIKRKDAELKDMQDRFMALVGDAFVKFQTKELISKPVPPPSYVDHLGNIVSMSEEQGKQAEQAKKEVLQILGH